jgi:hypothetical protein
MYNKILLGICIIIILIIIYFAFFYKKTIDSFDNLESNPFTYDTCCTQSEIAKCETYGKTGVCDYNKNDKSCMCQNSF